jgi:hypothetical protein
MQHFDNRQRIEHVFAINILEGNCEWRRRLQRRRHRRAYRDVRYFGCVEHESSNDTCASNVLEQGQGSGPGFYARYDLIFISESGWGRCVLTKRLGSCRVVAKRRTWVSEHAVIYCQYLSADTISSKPDTTQTRTLNRM